MQFSANMSLHGRFQNVGAFSGSPYNKDHGMMGSILGPPTSGSLHVQTSTAAGPNCDSIKGQWQAFEEFGRERRDCGFFVVPGLRGSGLLLDVHGWKQHAFLNFMLT